MYFYAYFESKINEGDINTIFFMLIKLIFDVLVTYLLLPSMAGIMVGAGLFIASILYTFSDIGEALFRNKVGRNQYADNKRLQELLKNAAELSGSKVSYEKIDFYLVESNKNYLYATSRHSIIYTNRFFSNPNNEIIAQLIRELKHIEDFDADDTLFVGAGDIYLDILGLLVRVVFYLLSLLMTVIDRIIEIRKDKKSDLSHNMVITGRKAFRFINNLWFRLGIIFIISNNTSKEKDCDKLVCELGYRNELVNLIDAGSYRNDIPLFETNLQDEKTRMTEIDKY